MILSSAPTLEDTAFKQLAAKADARRLKNLPYSGEVTPQEAFAYLSMHEGVLVDVRTLPEWQFTGVPNLAQVPGKLLTLSWKTYPDFALNPKFAAQLNSEISGKDTPLFFMCRSGGRSLDAAVAMRAAGYDYCFNITGGFEGEPDSQGHRGQVQGWKAAQLPWMQG